MKGTLRALRRHQLARMKRRWLARERGLARPADAAELVRRVGLRAHTGVLCSCPMCGNPRRHFGEASKQEKSWRELQRSLRDAPGEPAP